IPRLGAEYQLNKNFTVRGGVALEESPLKTTRNPELNYLDTDKLVVGLGISATYDRTRLLAYPVRLDLGYQYQQLQERDFTLVDYDGTETNVTADEIGRASCREIVNKHGDAGALKAADGC